LYLCLSPPPPRHTLFPYTTLFRSGSVDSLLEMLINMTASTSLIPVLFFLVGYIVLRAKKDHMERSFKVGSKNFGIAIGVLLLALDRKSTRLNSSHVSISYAVFCLK